MDKFGQRYKKLNKQQKRAVDTIEGPVLVVAGPGSGKTELLSLRVANILKKTDIFPQNILCLTFTDSASFNMKERLKELIGDEGLRVAVHTFHEFGVEIIQEHQDLFYEEALFDSADDLTQTSILENIFKQLSHDDPLSSYHSEYGYVYLDSVKSCIRDLKKAGLSPSDFFEILKHNRKSLKFLNPLIQKVFENRISKKIFPKVEEVLEKIKDSELGDPEIKGIKGLVPVVKESLEEALEKAKSKEKTSPLTLWKKNWTKRTDEKKRVLRDYYYQQKLESLGTIYEKYKEEMYKEGYYDFDDMILEVIKALKENDELRYELQEQYQYFLVDEFQDTNDAQMRLLYLLLDNPVNEGRPNVCAVGDDDQAIYKFQGAQISNILRFEERFREPEIIPLVKNYRSRQEILNIARSVITKGDKRLEDKLEELDKTLEAENDQIEEGDVKSKDFATEDHQYFWIAEEVKRLIEKGENPEEIAVIARRHKELEKMVDFLNQKDIPISYERKRNVLDSPLIIQLVKICRFVNSLLDKKQEKFHLLPDILSFPFWKLEREEIWKLSKKAKKTRKNWLDCMLESKNEKLKDIGGFLLDLASKAKFEPAGKILTEIIGDVEFLNSEESSDKDQEFKSSFKEYYFNEEKFRKNPGEYFKFLSSLKTFIYALRDYKRGSFLKLEDLIEFVEVHQENKIPLLDKNPIITGEEPITLTTAHNSKGMEFNSVFVLSCQDEIWAKNFSSSKLHFPKNLPISPAGDTRDDQLRLFYVAVSRTKSKLYLTSYRKKRNGKESSRLQFLVPEEEDLKEKLEPDSVKHKEFDIEKKKEILEASQGSFYSPPFIKDEEVILKNLLEDYKLNVTHLNNFLNVADGGPQNFLETNFLRFPRFKAPPLCFGSAVHSTIEQIYRFLKKEEKLPKEKKVMEWFEKFLYKERLSERDFKHYLEKGKDTLEVFYKKRKKEFDLSHLIEFNFKNQDVFVKDVPLSGKIDRIIQKDKEIEVHDFKTGKAVKNWKGRGRNEKVKLWKYKNQLMFYKLLVENSRRFNREGQVEKGKLEFVEPIKKNKIVDLSLQIKEDELERLKKLIEKVYEKIENFEFPDVEKYKDSKKGIKKFEGDLLNDRI